jgi:hypothetical protein
MAFRDMIAKTGFRYSTRRLLPGDVFTARDRDVRVLEAIGKAEVKRERVAVPPPPRRVKDKIHPLDHDSNGVKGGSTSAGGDELKALREQYREVIGKQAFNGWDADTLRQKIADAQK